MQQKHDWNPELYLKFNRERILPSIDLVSRINYERPSKIIDIGCGPGNSTQILHQRWPEASITGVDNSPAMIQRARTDYPDQKWVLFDAGIDEPDEKFDIVYSNATIQWIPDHESLIRRFAGFLQSQGILAVQIALFFDMDLGKSIRKIANQPKWYSVIRDVENLFTFHYASFYYDQLSKYFTECELWETQYIHIMDSHHAILEMIRSTGLKPYLEHLPDEISRSDFEKEVLSNIERDYPRQKNGRVLFPFKRLFFVAKK